MSVYYSKGSPEVDYGKSKKVEIMADGIRRADSPDSPTRCQQITKTGQCPLEAVQGTAYCQCHGGVSADNANQKKEVRNYNLARLQTRVNSFADNDKIKSLREEIGIVRLLLEDLINSCDSPNKLLIYSGTITDMVMKIKELVNSCHKLESSMGQMLDRQMILNFASTVVGIISEEITDPVVLNRIADRITNSIAEVTK